LISKQGRNLSLALIVGLFFSLVAWEVSIDGLPLPYFFVQSNLAINGGLYWQLFTSLFVVIPFSSQGPLGIADVLFNMVAIMWLDGLLSFGFQEWDYYAVFVLSGLVGNITSLFNGPGAASFGASGGIFGLLAGAIAQEFAVEKRVDYSLLVWFLAVFIFSSFALSYVDWLAHLGGAAAGLVAGYLLGNAHGRELP